MSEHLLAISIGPVQDFIAAARRTRDLWFGSHVLSEISKAAAKAVADYPGVGLDALIFPAPQTAVDLALCNTQAIMSVANVILAKIPAGTIPADIALAAKKAAESRWREFAEKAKNVAGQIRNDVWQDQVDDVVECYSAWTMLPSIADYQQTRKDVMRLLAGRKACRNFVMAKGRAKLPKSSLDGARETVLELNRKGTGRLPLADGEQLDVIGLTKRLAGEQQSYPSVARIAADPWLRTLASSQSHVDDFNLLKEICERMISNNGLSRSEMPSETLPYDGTAVFLNRHPDLAKEMGHEIGSQAQQDLTALSAVVSKLTRSVAKGGLGEPNPYLAIIVADGDRMGAAISNIKAPEDHRRLSAKLSEFSQEAKGVVQVANGVCVYAGGDDVLALVPLDSCLKCARDLHSVFGKSMRDWKTADGKSPTLSVGIAIGHMMESLEDLLGFGRAAEQAAKKSVELGGTDERNALAVLMRNRGADAVRVRDNWLDENDSAALDQRLYRWAELFVKGSLPNKLPYDLRQLVPVYERWPTTNKKECEVLEKVLQKDVGRILKRKRSTLLIDERDDISEAEKQNRSFLKDRIGSIKSIADLKSLAEELLIAQQISAALPPRVEPLEVQPLEAIR